MTRLFKASVAVGSTMVLLAVLPALGQTAPVGSALVPGSGRATSATGQTVPGAGRTGQPAPAATGPTRAELKLNAEAEAARKTTDDRLQRRDAAARRSLKGICTGC